MLYRTKKTSSTQYIRRENEDSSLSSGSENSERGHGLNKYYKQAWDDLQHTAGTKIDNIYLFTLRLHMSYIHPIPLHAKQIYYLDIFSGGDVSKATKKHPPLARTVTLDHPTSTSGHPRVSRTETLDNPGFRSHRSIGSSLTVNDLATVYISPEHDYGKSTGRKERHQRNERDWRKY